MSLPEWPGSLSKRLLLLLPNSSQRYADLPGNTDSVSCQSGATGMEARDTSIGPKTASVASVAPDAVDRDGGIGKEEKRG
ncbi:hypothetical protein ZHAS_00017588 [Anopheles sinensis]|uniref:Uncharacterized protein n=1 Tax=Anopheles sinensis TaxID=74873 RepID=A0A084WH84_ANOSI|nr:hypothetical protein ZHAS_00017588 [Anopheles sinensis]